MNVLDNALAELREVNKAFVPRAIEVPAPAPKPVVVPRAPDDAHLDPVGRRYLVKSWVGGEWQVDEALLANARALAIRNNDTTIMLKAQEVERGDDSVRRQIAQRAREAEVSVAPGAFLRDLNKAYMPGTPVPLTAKTSPPSIVMGPVRRYAATGEIDTDSVVVNMIKVYAKLSRGESISSQEQVLMAIAYPGQVEITDPVAKQALDLVAPEEREQIRAMYEARLLEIISYAQQSFPVVEGQSVTLRQS